MTSLYNLNTTDCIKGKHRAIARYSDKSFTTADNGT